MNWLYRSHVSLEAARLPSNPPILSNCVANIFAAQFPAKFAASVALSLLYNSQDVFADGGAVFIAKQEEAPVWCLDAFQNPHTIESCSEYRSIAHARIYSE